MLTYFGMEIAGARVQGLALSSLVTLVIGAWDGSNILLFVNQPSQTILTKCHQSLPILTNPYHNPYHDPYHNPYCKLPPQDRGVGKIRDAKTEQTMTKIRDAKTEQTMTSQECLRMRAQNQSKGDSKVLFLIF